MTASPYERPPDGTVIEGIGRAVVTCRKHGKWVLYHETNTHKAERVSVSDNVKIVVKKSYCKP